MPWTPKADRVQFEHSLQNLVPRLTHKEAGNLTYVLYEIPVRIWAREKRWTTACIILGAMLGALLCFFLKHVWPYELSKMKNNETDGDLA